MEAFSEWVVREGETWDALKKGVKAGIKAFRQAKTEAKVRQMPDQLMTALINAKTKEEVRAVAEKMAENGLVFSSGKIQPEPPIRKWISEDVQTQERNETEESSPVRSWQPLDLKRGKLVGNPYYSYPQRGRPDPLVRIAAR